MYDGVKYFVTKICKSIKDKTANTLPQTRLKTTTSSSSMELIGLGFWHLDTCTGTFQCLLAITDNFRRSTQVYPTNKSSHQVIWWLHPKIWNPWKNPPRQDREFQNKLFTHLSKICHIKRLGTTPYNPESDWPSWENKSIIVKLKTLEETEKKSWKEHVQILVYAYRLLTIFSFVWDQTQIVN